MSESTYHNDDRISEGWAASKVGDFLELKYGKGLTKENRKNGTVPVFGSNGQVGQHNASVTQCPTIIVGRKGSVGAVNYSSEPCWPIDTTYFIDDTLGCDIRFLYYGLQTLGLEEMDTSTAIPGLNRDDVYACIFPVAPLAEQKRIVAKVEALLGRVNQARERLGRVPDILKRFRQSVLAAACSGQLTADWREGHDELELASNMIVSVTSQRHERYNDACRVAKSGGTRKPRDFDNYSPQLRDDLELIDLPPEWVWVDLRFVMDEQKPFCYGVVQPGKHTPGGVLLVRAGNLDHGSVDVSELRTISPDVDKDYERSRLEGGEVLVTVVGANIGTVAIAPESCRGFNIARAVAKVPVRDFNAKYVHLWLTSPTALSWMKQDAREVARPTLNLEQLRTLPVPLPPLVEQQESVRRVTALFALADRIEQRLTAATTRTDRITQSVLAKAFSGELVETEADLARREARDYEPASVLLERIAEQRQVARNGEPKRAKKAKAKRPAKSKKAVTK